MNARLKLLRDAGLLPLACTLAMAAPAAAAAKHQPQQHPMPHNFIRAQNV